MKQYKVVVTEHYVSLAFDVKQVANKTYCTLSMLERIAEALKMKVELRLVPKDV